MREQNIKESIWEIILTHFRKSYKINLLFFDHVRQVSVLNQISKTSIVAENFFYWRCIFDGVFGFLGGLPF